MVIWSRVRGVSEVDDLPTIVGSANCRAALVLGTRAFRESLLLPKLCPALALSLPLCAGAHAHTHTHTHTPPPLSPVIFLPPPHLPAVILVSHFLITFQIQLSLSFSCNCPPGRVSLISSEFHTQE